MRMTKTHLPGKFHNAVVKWRQTFLPDYDFLIENWEKHFPRDRRVRALRLPGAGDVQRDRVR